MAEAKKEFDPSAEEADQADAQETAAQEAAPLDDEPGETLEEVQAERDELKERFVRALAEAENTRKRADRDRREAERYGASRLARDLLPVWDNLHRALAAATDEQRQTDAALIEGVELTLRELENVFSRHGVTIVRPVIGDAFDPQTHEAMFEAPAPGTRAGDIIQVMSDGFFLHDRLLRPAQVGVSSTPGS
jgi:molecular chaperone GrpE